MTRMTLVLVITAMVVLIVGCSSTKVTHDYDPAADFGQFKTFKWLDVPTSAAGEGLQDQLGDLVREAVNKQLTAKGVTEVDDDPDVLMVYHAVKEPRINTEEWGYKYDPNWGKGDDIQTYDYTVGTLIVDMVDAESKAMLWRGTAEKILSESPSPESQAQQIGEAVAKIFEDFPPKK
ncbi:MAG: DUF4136 domain-containing protein [Candidatus Latescibacterota bacterium]|nr:MAG: DUF4136 domain-containing protein [Candidatus Latescibacterota bacterium]